MARFSGKLGTLGRKGRYPDFVVQRVGSRIESIFSLFQRIPLPGLLQNRQVTGEGLSPLLKGQAEGVK